MSVEPLNLDGKSFLGRIGVTYHNDILLQLRELNLVNFFKVGKKYMYPAEDAKKISEKLRRREISIRTNNGYYIHINDLKRP